MLQSVVRCLDLIIVVKVELNQPRSSNVEAKKQQEQCRTSNAPHQLKAKEEIV